MTNTEQPGLDAGALEAARATFRKTTWEDDTAKAVVSAYLAALPKPTDEFAAPQTRCEARRLAGEWQNRADDCGRLARAVLAPDTVGVPSPFPYQKTFDAIAAATKIKAGHISISVTAFKEAFLASPLQLDEDRSFAAVIEARAFEQCAEVMDREAKYAQENLDAITPEERDSTMPVVAHWQSRVSLPEMHAFHFRRLSALSKRAGEREGDNAVWNEAVEACAARVDRQEQVYVAKRDQADGIGAPERVERMENYRDAAEYIASALRIELKRPDKETET